MSSGNHVTQATSGRAAQQVSVDVDRVSKTFKVGGGKTLTAIDDIDLRIEPGEFVALIGPSGCGKSTLLRMMAGLEAPSAGTVMCDGTLPDSLVQQHRLGFAFQEHALLPWLSVEQNIELPFRLARQQVDASAVAHLIDLIGLNGFERSRPRQLSGGMRQRVAIARSLVMNPALLLLDEPFGALDAITRRRLNFELARIWEETGATTVMVTHAVDEAVLLSDRVIVMSGRPGRVLAEVPIDIPRPRTAEVETTTEFARLQVQLLELLDEAERSTDRTPS